MSLIAASLAAQIASAQTPGLEGARLLAGRVEGGRRVAGLELRLSPGWKTYWRIPGEAGIAPQFDWSGSENLRAIAPLWPAPEVSRDFGMISFGYHDALLLPLRVTPEDPTKPVTLRLSGLIGLCREICAPAHLDLSATFAPDETAQAGRIDAALARRPEDAAALGLREAACSVTGAGAERRLSARLRFDAAPALPAAAAEGPAGVWIGPMALKQSGATLELSADLLLDDPDAWLARDAFDLTLIGDEGAWTLRGCAAAG